MVSIHDVITYILSKTGKVDNWKLHRFLYYSQVWYLVWENKPLFDCAIEAWISGPVVRDIHHLHIDFLEDEWSSGSSENLSPKETNAIDSVMRFYGEMPSQELFDLTRQEDPWKRARVGVRDCESGHSEITHADIIEYYGELPPYSE